MQPTSAHIARLETSTASLQNAADALQLIQTTVGWQVTAAGIGVAFIVVGMAGPVLFGRSWGKPMPQTSKVLLILGLLTFSLIAVSGMIDAQLWGSLMAIVPPLLIVQQAIYNRLIRRPTLYEDTRQPTGDMGSRSIPAADEARMRGYWAAASVAHNREFSVNALGIRFGLPAALTLMVGVAIFQVLRYAHQAIADGSENLLADYPALVSGACYGAAGAYTYVLLLLGQRAMRRDVTSGAAVWSPVMLVAGALLGGVVAMVWRTQNNKTSTDALDWSEQVLFFVTGLAPREAVSVIREGARRVWLSYMPTVVESKVKPLTRIRGITSEIAQRLEEENITDAYGLAMANPLKLFRNTNFDKRQILGWIDEALLIYTVEEWAEKLQAVGITGAVDFAYHAHTRSSVFKSICVAAGVPEAKTPALQAVAARLYDDAQLCLVWALYQSPNGETADAADSLSAVPAEDEEGGLEDLMRPSRRREYAPGGTFSGGASGLLAAIAAILAAVFWSTNTAATGRDLRVAVAMVASALAGCLLSWGLACYWRWQTAQEDSPPKEGKPSVVDRRSIARLGVGLLLMGVATVVLIDAGGWWPDARLGVGPMLAALAIGCLGWFVTSGLHAATWVKVKLEGLPPAALVTYDGQRPLGSRDTHEVPRAELILKVTAPGHAPHEARLDTRFGDRLVRLQLTQLSTKIVSLELPDIKVATSVYLNERCVAIAPPNPTRPITIELESSRLTWGCVLTLRSRTHEDVEIYVDEHCTTPTVPPFSPKPCFVRLEGDDVEGARVWVEGRRVALENQTFPVPAGRPKIEVQLPGGPRVACEPQAFEPGARSILEVPAAAAKPAASPGG